MDSNSLVRAVALLAKLQPLLLTFHEEKTWYKKLLEGNEKSEKNDFLIQKTSSHLNDLEKITCMIEDLLYPEEKKELQDPEGIIKFLEDNKLIKAKIMEKMNPDKKPV